MKARCLRFSSTFALLATLSLSLFANAEDAPARRRGRAPKRRPAPTAVEACPSACASNELCVHGACVPKCNPLCGEGEVCTDEGQCEAAPREPEPATRAGRGGSKAGSEGAEVTPPFGDAGSAARAAAGGEAVGEAAISHAAMSNERPGVHRHDGFFMRLGIGPSGLLGSADGIDSDGNLTNTTLYGGGGGIEVALGGTLGKGIVIGGMIQPLFIARHDRYELRPGLVTFVGPFVDFYPNPEKGFHVQAGIGHASSHFRESNAGSLGLMAGAGYEWWVGEQWSIGLLGRINRQTPEIVYHNDGTGDFTTTSTDASMFIFSTMLSFTYH